MSTPHSTFTPDTQLNWLARYLPIKHLLVEGTHSLLEVGSGHRGVGCIFNLPFIGAEVLFNSPPRSPMQGVQYGGDLLPFKSGAFHTVLSMDTYEHVAPEKRPGFLKELTRVSAERVILACPVDQEGLAVDRYFQKLFSQLSQGEPDWLREHEAMGLPVSNETEALLDSLAGWRWKTVPTTGSLANVLLILADVLPGMHQWVAPALEHHSAELEEWIIAGSFGPSYRKVYLLERLAVLTPFVDLREPFSLTAAFACADCGGDLEGDHALSCLACGRAYAKNSAGILDFSGQKASTKPSQVTFCLKPNWLANTEWCFPLHNYLQAFSPEDPCTLRLLVDLTQLSMDEALSLLRPLLASFGDRAFPALELEDDFNKPPLGVSVQLPEPFEALSAWSVAKFRQTRDQLLPLAGALKGEPHA